MCHANRQPKQSFKNLVVLMLRKTQKQYSLGRYLLWQTLWELAHWLQLSLRPAIIKEWHLYIATYKFCFFVQAPTSCDHRMG